MTLATALILALAPAPDQALAQALPSLDEAKAQIAEVLAQPDFGKLQEVRGWVYVGDGTQTDLDGEGDLGWLKSVAQWIAAAAEPIRWGLALAAAVLVALLLQQILRGLPTGGRVRLPRRRRGAGPESLGPAAAPASLPGDIPAAVRARLAAGDDRAALALLYRAGIARLRGLGLSIPPGATEGECVRLAAPVRPAPELAYLRRLTRLWQDLAYAHCSPARGDIDDLLGHWEDWGTWTGTGEGGAGAG